MNTALRAYFGFDFRLAFRDRLVLLMTLAVPAVMYGFFGLMYGHATYGEQSVSYYDEYTPSFIGLVMLNVALMNVAPVLVIYKEQGLFRRLLVTPLDMGAVWFSAVSRAFAIFLLGLVEMMIVGWLMFHRLPDTSLLQLLSALVVSAYALFSLGFLVGSLARTANASFTASSLLFQPMLLLSGASIPLDQFPAFVQKLAQLVPMTHAVEALRLAWRGEFFTPAGLSPTLVLLAFGTACALVARHTFRWSAR
ncbi:ABC transporter permease [Pseudorhodoferax sp.]|uniref:ABC transporter permease n=1 Tax=Pseudorhodoferax sp. TaxID=1993553 RepID=UPI002DD6342D|nr:ABC transporter permease [Pseudorhodoferax sp.]